MESPIGRRSLALPFLFTTKNTKGYTKNTKDCTKHRSHRHIHPYRLRIKARRCFVLLSEEVVSLEARAEEDFSSVK
jgi:hypothetical protein